MVHLIDLIVDNITRLVPGQKKVGVMASTAVLSTGLYEKRFQKHNVYSQGSEIFKNRWSDKEGERRFHRGAKRKTLKQGAGYTFASFFYFIVNLYLTIRRNHIRPFSNFPD